MAGSWQLFVDDKSWMGKRDLYVRCRAPDGTLHAVTTMQTHATEPGLVYEPLLSESREDVQDNTGDVSGFLQAALQAAWDLGMRPQGFADHKNELTAVRYHLEDMRTLAMVTKP